MNSSHELSASESSRHTPPGIEPAEVEQALDAILADDKFAAAPQMSAFLAYVVKQTLLGEADRIKAYTVAVDALGKPASFDPQNDPSVRVLAKRLRSSIDQYYERTSGHSVIIELKSGSYKPRFISVSRQPGAADAEPAQHGTDTRAEPAATVSQSADTGVTLEAGSQALHESAGNLTVRQPLDESLEVSAEQPAGSVQADPAPADGGAPQTRRSGLQTALRRVPHPAMLAIVVVVLGWGISQHRQEARLREELATIVGNSGVMIGDKPLHIALASTSDGQTLRPRPALPTIHLPAMQDQDALGATLSASITRVLSRFENIEVIRQHATSEVQWPEDYELHFSDYRIDDRIRVEAQLLRSATSRVVLVDTFDLPDLEQDRLTTPELEKIEAFAAKIAQLNGPLIRDYLSQSNLSPDVACALGVDPATLSVETPTAGPAAAATDDTVTSDVQTGSTAGKPFECDRSTAGTTRLLPYHPQRSS